MQMYTWTWSGMFYHVFAPNLKKAIVTLKRTYKPEEVDKLLLIIKPRIQPMPAIYVTGDINVKYYLRNGKELK